DQKVVEVHEAQNQVHDADSRHGLLEHVGDGRRRAAGVDQDCGSAEVDEVEADHQEPVHGVGQAVLLENGHQERPAVTKESVADPDGKEDADGDVDGVVDQSQVHVYHPSSDVNLNTFNSQPR